MGKSSQHINHEHRNSSALLIIDMMNTLDFPEGEKLLIHALPAARAILELKKKMKGQGIPVIYVNDNFGQWRSSWEKVFQICCKEGRKGKPLAELLKPSEDDYFVLKPKHSGFYCTTLDLLLKNLGVKTLILTGIAGNICVLFTANDAHMRDYEVIVPKDCIASNTLEDNEFALKQLSRVFGISTTSSHQILGSSLKSREEDAEVPGLEKIGENLRSRHQNFGEGTSEHRS